jgi:hypothetical protein
MAIKQPGMQWWSYAMADLAELFPGVDLGGVPSGGGCTAPIGHRRSRRAQPALRRYRPSSATMMMLAGLRTQLGDGLDSVKRTLTRIEGDVARTADSAADLTEAVDHMRIRLTALERHAGLRPQPEVPRHSRRRPLE